MGAKDGKHGSNNSPSTHTSMPRERDAAGTEGRASKPPEFLQYSGGRQRHRKRCKQPSQTQAAGGGTSYIPKIKRTRRVSIATPGITLCETEHRRSTHPVYVGNDKAIDEVVCGQEREKGRASHGIKRGDSCSTNYATDVQETQRVSEITDRLK